MALKLLGRGQAANIIEGLYVKLIEEAIARFGEKIGIPDLTFSSENICALTINDEIEVFFQVREFQAHVVRINSKLADLKDVSSELFRDLLMANYNGNGTGEAALAINDQTAEVMLTQPLNVERLSTDDFLEAVNTFVKYTIFWKAELPELQKQTAVRSEDPVAVDALSSHMPFLVP